MDVAGPACGAETLVIELVFEGDELVKQFVAGGGGVGGEPLVELLFQGGVRLAYDPNWFFEDVVRGCCLSVADLVEGLAVTAAL